VCDGELLKTQSLMEVRHSAKTGSITLLPSGGSEALRVGTLSYQIVEDRIMILMEGWKRCLVFVVVMQW
jgi:hypothetical protein